MGKKREQTQRGKKNRSKKKRYKADDLAIAMAGGEWDKKMKDIGKNIEKTMDLKLKNLKM